MSHSDIVGLAIIAVAIPFAIYLIQAVRGQFVVFMDYGDLAWNMAPIPIASAFWIVATWLWQADNASIVAPAIAVAGTIVGAIVLGRNCVRSYRYNAFLSTGTRLIVAGMHVAFSVVFFPLLVLALIGIAGKGKKDSQLGPLGLVLGLFLGWLALLLVNGNKVVQLRQSSLV